MTTNDYLKQIDSVIADGKFKDNWQSLSNHKTPEWYYKGKFGIFVHWGIYSVPAFGNEWYSRNMYNQRHREFEHHIKTYGSQKDFGYKDFIPMFKGENFDAAKWIELFKNAGAKFVVPVAEHHDGFAMYETEFNRWNAKEMGPKRDIIGELKAECEKQGLTFCASNHRAEHYFFMGIGTSFDSDMKPGTEWFDFYAPAYYDEAVGDKTIEACDTIDEFAATDEYMEDWMVRVCEIIDKYQPKIIYFDWWIQNQCFKPYLKKIAAYYYNRAEEWGAEVTIDFKHNAYPLGTATLDIERGSLGEIFPYPWQTDTAIGKRSWGYTTDNEFKTPYDCITTLIDVVSKNGMLLLNVGPKADGSITAEETAVLQSIGEWLTVNGEGIYETIPYKFYKEGEHAASSGMFSEGTVEYDEHDFRFTYKNGAIYAFQMKPSKEVHLNSFYTIKCGILIENVELLGGEVESFVCNADGLSITCKDEPKTDLPQCFKITLG